MNEWKTVTLGEVTSFMSKGIAPVYTDEREEGVVVVLNQKCNRNFSISFEESRLHDATIKRVPNDRILLPGDVLINSTGAGTAGRVAQIWNVPSRTTVDGHMIILRCTDSVDPLYYGYALKLHQSQIESLAEGSTGQTEINRKRLFDEVLISYPTDIALQRKIARTLAALDEKIEANRAINDNLQQQLEALYRGTINVSASECGSVTLDEWCHIFTGKKNANQFDEDGQYMFFTCGEKPLRINSYIYDGPAIIVSGNGSYTGRTLFYNGKFDLYQRTYACTLKESLPADFIFGLFAVLKIELHAKIAGGTHGSSIPYIVMNDLAKFEFPYSHDEFTAFSGKAKTLLTAIQHNQQENEVLSQIRDALLPRLMSGELDVTNLT